MEYGEGDGRGAGQQEVPSTRASDGIAIRALDSEVVEQSTSEKKR